MRYAQIRSMDVSNGEGVGVSLSSFRGVHFTVKIASIPKLGILMVVKNGQKKQKKSL